MPTRRYRCEHCQQEFVTEQDDEIAQAEAVRNFGRRGDSGGMAETCDDCYRAFMQWLEAQQREH